MYNLNLIKTKPEIEEEIKILNTKNLNENWDLRLIYLLDKAILQGLNGLEKRHKNSLNKNEA
jgi:hypothetical protein